MNARSDEVRPWTPKRWAITIGFVVALHFAFLYTLSNRPLKEIRRLPASSVILPEGMAGELQLLTDPTLLAMGGPHGFSSIWMESPALPPVNPNWKQDPKWLNVEPSRLAMEFVEYARSNAASLHGLKFKTAPQPLPDESTKGTAPVRTMSTMRVAGDLVERRVVSPPDLPSQSGPDLLGPSEVRVVVDSRGIVTSSILLPPGSGSKQADRTALELARRIRFSPGSSSGQTSPLTFGRLVFEWQTEPLSVTPKSSNE